MRCGGARPCGLKEGVQALVLLLPVDADFGGFLVAVDFEGPVQVFAGGAGCGVAEVEDAFVVLADTLAAQGEQLGTADRGLVLLQFGCWHGGGAPARVCDCPAPRL